ncbi:NAD-dependent epimerase/dehydratase family protein [Dokdonia sinensis]|uniref:NAD-dependent epimerase/dehydratase family protein n=1 Tax=Dokdonia sinensis TaxID=2479847 RepID=A0A3M0GMJ5_9FLAO|nr:NAD-dependent epimerase/dehydratase family protein [Dokdonia sinensis]RMB63942.1 NAD-dependent epimerase/dehydratase family protein [Dokdonia sinensis]
MQHTSLVTGGAGFIGSHVARQLLKLNHQVIILDDLSGGFKENIPEGCIFIQGSITDVDLVNAIFEKYNFDYVYHLAAYAAEGLSHFIRRFNYQNNLIGSVNLINASVNHNIKCFIFTSSIAVYGTQDLPLKESQKPQPEDPYGIAKYAVEMDLENAHKMFGLDYIIFRPHNVYGPGQNIGDKYRNVVGIFMNQILKGEPLTIFGDGEQTRAFTYIDDVAPYIAGSFDLLNKTDTSAPLSGREAIFNIGSDSEITVKKLALEIGKAMQKEAQITHLDQREEVVHAYSDHSHFNRVFNPKPSTSLAEGLAKTVAWVKKHGARESSTFKNIEIQKNLPKSWQ